MIAIFILGFFINAQDLKILKNTPINDGEVLEFRLSYGWFTIGRAAWYTSVQNYHGENCFRTKVRARSSGLLGVFAKVEDEWGEYTSQSDWLPRMAWRDLEEGKYIMEDKTYFDYEKKRITYKWKKQRKDKPTKYLKMDQDRLGMLGGFMKIRSLDFSKYKPGESISIEAFFEGEPYNIEVVYKGTERIKSKVGKLMSHKVVPRLPENRLFLGEDPITVWFSADMNQLPLRANARMSFGTAYVELIKYKNVKF